MPDRTINFGESETEATYQIQDTDGAVGGGNFVLAKDTNANTVLLEYQPGSDTWQYAGDVDMGGGDITNVNGLTASSAIIGGTLTATDVNTDSVNTDSASVTNQLDAGSVNTDELSDGVAGSGNTTTLIAGDQGDFVPLISTQFLPGETVNISSTSYTQLGTVQDAIVLSDAADFLQNVDNLQAAVGFRIDGKNNGAETVTLRLRNSEDTAVTGDMNAGQPGDSELGPEFTHYLEGKVDQGDADVTSMTLTVGGEIA